MTSAVMVVDKFSPLGLAIRIEPESYRSLHLLGRAIRGTKEKPWGCFLLSLL